MMRMTMKVYQIYVDGEKTDNYYEVYTEEEAIEEYKKDCIEAYKRDFGGEPDMTCFEDVEAIEMNN